MARGFVTGVLWGCIVVGGGLAVMSQMAPPPAVVTPALVVAVAPAVVVAPVAKVAPVVEPAKVVESAKVVEPAKAPEIVTAPLPAPVVAKPEAVVPVAPVAEAVATADVAKVAPATPELAKVEPVTPTAPEVAKVEPVAPVTAEVAKVEPVVPAAPVVEPVAPAAPEVAKVEPVAPAAPVVEPVAPVTAEVAKVEPAVPAKTALIVVAAVAPVVPAVPQPDAPAAAVAGLAVAALPGPLPDRPAAPDAPPSLAGLEPALTAPGAEVAPLAVEAAPAEPAGPQDALLAPDALPTQEASRLPQIAPVQDPGVTAVVPDAVAVPVPEAQPKESVASTITDAAPSTLPPAKGLTDRVPTVLGKPVPGVQTNALPQIGGVAKVAPAVVRPVSEFARPFDGAAGKPLFVILLHDVGSAGMARAELAKLPFPVSFVVDPLATDAKAASQAYRAAGQEVLTLANGIPQGALASDVAETFQTLSGILPESVAVIDQDLGGFQDNRPLAGLVLPVLQDEGRGLVTYDRGLNAADQIARRDGVPSAVIFRRLDGEGEAKAVIRRYLDRAAFKAAQEGSVVVIGDTRAETVAAILEWTVEGRASSVTLAPLTAVLGK